MVDGLRQPDERLEAYRRVQSFKNNPHLTAKEYADSTDAVRNEIQVARELLPDVQINDEIAHLGLEMIDQLDIDSLRAEITLFEAARAYAASDGRTEVEMHDLEVVAPMALRLRRSQFMTEYFEKQKSEENEIHDTIKKVLRDEK
jgi:Mg-chelatase subunit ChlI